LVFTDLVDSVALRRQLGDKAGTSLLPAHRQLVRQTLARFADAEEIETAGDSSLLLFARPSDAVKFALIVQMQTRALAVSGRSSRREEALTSAELGTRNAEFNQSLLTSAATALKARIGIHVGEVVIEEHERGLKTKDVYGTQISLCARV
jgi:class 3 adenylate cyclase